MGGKTDVAKGRIKEAAGVLTGNDKLRAEGKADQAVGKVKQVVFRKGYIACRGQTEHCCRPRLRCRAFG